MTKEIPDTFEGANMEALFASLGIPEGTVLTRTDVDIIADQVRNEVHEVLGRRCDVLDPSDELGLPYEKLGGNNG